MNFAIDIIWIGANKKIVDITKNAEPAFLPKKLYLPNEKSQYALEVNAGFVKKHNVKIGNKVKFNL